MPRGRRRSQPVRTAPADVHGERVAQERAQAALPLPATAAATPGQLGAPVSPAELPPLEGPTGRPEEPITAGLPIGPGLGPEALGPQGLGGPDIALSALKFVFQQAPTDELAQIIARMESDRR